MESIFGTQMLPEKFLERMERHFDELKWLYMELYPGCQEQFASLCQMMLRYYAKRPRDLMELDLKRESDPHWYKKREMLGMMLYVDAFAGDLQGVEEHLDYLKECQVNYLHLMPLLDTTEGKSDGGYAVSDYRKVRPDLGTMKDLRKLSRKCHDQDICLCLDYVMNHTSEDHPWAKKAREGEPKYQDYYYFYENREIPDQYEQTVPQVFPTTAPGNFTWLEDKKQYVMTTFYPYQWDLNYGNPAVLEEMTENLLFLANEGIDILRIDAVPYIWKELGTSCRNLPQVHTIVRMLRMIGEIVCPGIVLLGEVVMEPEKVVPYFGTTEKPECHMLYNVTTMATIWHTVATGDIRLLKKQLDQVFALPTKYCFLNYLRCHDDIGWGLDYDSLEDWGMTQVSHKKYLNDYFLGKISGSTSCGELYNDDAATGDARFCGTTASMCGIEKALEEKDEKKIREAVRKDLMLHGFMFFQSGIPVIYSGDEVAKLNDWEYHQNPLKAEDSRYLHRGTFDWKCADNRRKKGTVAQEVFSGIRQLEQVRFAQEVLDQDAQVYTYDTHDQQVLGIIRIKGDQKMVGFFNFSGTKKKVTIYDAEEVLDLIQKTRIGSQMELEPYGFGWYLVL